MSYVADNAIDQYGTSLSSTSLAQPYVPQTINDLLAAIGTYGAYVKIENDFDFSTNDSYKISIPEPVVVRCTKLFADDKNADGDKYSISGINCGSLSTFMQADGYDGSTYINPEINNVAIVNCVYRCYYDSNLFISTSAVNTHIKFVSCQTSFLIICSTVGIAIDGGNVEFENCSEYYKFVQDDSVLWISTDVGVFDAVRTNCTVQFTGLKYQTKGQFVQYVNPILIGAKNKYLAHCTFFGDVKCIPFEDSDNTWINVQSYNNCCFVLNITKPSGKTVKFNSFNSYGTTTPIIGTSVIDSTALNGVVVDAQYNANLKPLSTADIKDEDKLIDIGFLP